MIQGLEGEPQEKQHGPSPCEPQPGIVERCSARRGKQGYADPGDQHEQDRGAAMRQRIKPTRETGIEGRPSVDGEHPDDGERPRHVNADDSSARALVCSRLLPIVVPRVVIIHAG